MKPESIVLAVAGMCFGVIVGWVLASLDINRPPPVAAPPQAQASTAEERQPPQLDEGRVQALTTILKNDPSNSGAAVQLGDLYLEADRLEEATKWFLEALRVDPKNADASAQLGIAYLVTKGPDQALEQIERSLKMSPNHPKTLLNKGIVLWRGKQDLDGAAVAWQKLVDVAPSSPEAEMAKQGLQMILNRRGGGATTPPTNQ